MTEQRPDRQESREPGRTSHQANVGPDDEGSFYDISAPTPPAGIPLSETWKTPILPGSGEPGPDDTLDHDGDPGTPGEIRRPPLTDGNLDLDAPAPEELVELAAGLGVATEFKDWKGKLVPVSTHTLCGVLAALDMPVRTGVHVRAALAELKPPALGEAAARRHRGAPG